MQVIKKIIEIIKDLNLAGTILLHAPDYTCPELHSIDSASVVFDLSDNILGHGKPLIATYLVVCPHCCKISAKSRVKSRRAVNEITAGYFFTRFNN